VRHRVEKAFDIGFNHISIATEEQLPSQRCDRIQCSDSQPVAKTAGQEILLVDGLNKPRYGALKQLIFYDEYP